GLFFFVRCLVVLDRVDPVFVIVVVFVGVRVAVGPEVLGQLVRSVVVRVLFVALVVVLEGVAGRAVPVVVIVVLELVVGRLVAVLVLVLDGVGVDVRVGDVDVL